MLYRAPEILFHMSRYSIKSDMWSVGCIFAEMVRFTPMFEAGSDIELVKEIYRRLGTPSEKDIYFFNDPSLIVEQAPPECELGHYVPGLDEQGVDLLSV